MFTISIAILLWLINFMLDKGSNIPYGMRGGGGKDPAPPTPPPPAPSPTETSAQAIQAQIDAIPKQLEAQREFAPQFSQLELDQLKQFAPQFAQAGLDLSQQFGEQFAQQALAEQDILDPSRSAGSRAVNEFLTQGPQGLTPEDEAALQESVRASTSARGLGASGLSAQEEVGRIFGARQALKDRYLNVALSASGRLPAAQGGQTVQGQTGGPGQLVQNVNPATFFGGQASNNSFASSIYNTQGSIFGQQLANPSGNALGSLLGGAAGTLAGSFLGPVGAGLGRSAGTALGGSYG